MNDALWQEFRDLSDYALRKVIYTGTRPEREVNAARALADRLNAASSLPELGTAETHLLCRALSALRGVE